MSKHASLTFQVVWLSAVQYVFLRKAIPNLPLWLIGFLSTILGLATILLWRIHVAWRFGALHKLPGPKIHNSFWGQSAAIFDEPIGSKISQWNRDIPNGGLLYFRGILGSEYVIVTDIEGLKDVLLRNAYDFEKASAFRRYTRRFIGQGLIIDEGDAHRHHRRLVGPVFQQRRVDDLKHLLSSKSEDLVQQLLVYCNKHKTIDISDWASRIALDVACIVGLGVDYDIVNGENADIFEAYQTIFACSDGKKAQFMWHNSAPKWLVTLFPSRFDHQMDSAYDSIRKLVQKIADERIEHGGLIDNGLGLDFLTQLVRSGEFTSKQCVEQVLIILAAGHESTAGTISWLVNELALHQAIQHDLRQEIMAHGSVQGHLFAEGIDDLPLLNAICLETIRLHPTVPMTLRKAIRETVIGMHKVPAGTYVAIVAEAINKSPEFWGGESLSFNPGRWVTDAMGGKSIDPLGGSLSPYCVQTFLHGPRGCIGKPLAIAEIKRVIAALVSRFTFMAIEEDMPSPTGFITVKPRPGYKVCIRPLT